MSKVQAIIKAFEEYIEREREIDDCIMFIGVSVCVSVLVILAIIVMLSGCGDAPTQSSEANLAPESEFRQGWRAADAYFATWGEAATDGEIAAFVIAFEIPLKRVIWYQDAEGKWHDKLGELVPIEEIREMKAVDVVFRLAPDWDSFTRWERGAMSRMKFGDKELIEVYESPAED